MSVAFPDSNPVLFGTRAPQGSRRPVDSTSPSTARVSCITRACPPTPRRRLRALEPPARSSPPISNDSPPHPPEAHRSVGGAWACVAVRRVVLGHRGVGSARWCVLGGAVCHRPHRNVRRSTERECRSVQRAWHPPARPPRRLGVASGGAFRSFGVCIAATGRPRSVCTSPRENEDGGSDGICAAPQSPEPPDQQNVVTNRLEYSPHRTPSGTFESPDLMLTWGGRTPSHRRLNTRRRHYFGSGAFCCDLLPAPVSESNSHIGRIAESQLAPRDPSRINSVRVRFQ